MAPLISTLNPVPSFPEYTGPYKVGTIDVEVPILELTSPSPAPEGSEDVQTVLFRIFYPAEPGSRGKRVSWLPAPQRLHIAAYAQFVGARPTLASMLSFLPRHLHWTSIPAFKNATLLSPPSDRPRSRWPTMIFSHGLGGNRNAYSHIAGSLASYGVVVICPEHRDGSAALSLIRNPKNPSKSTMVPYVRLPHDQTHEIWEARNKQLRIRLWELGLIFDALTKLDQGNEPLIKSNLNTSTPRTALAQFTNTLDILEPGKVIFSGHSFGAATMIQLIKSTFYADHPSLHTTPSSFNPLFTPSPTSPLPAQITPSTPTILLDMWCFPLLAASTSPLAALPLPCYTPNSPGGSTILAIESAHFLAWSTHLHAKARILSPDPSSPTAIPSEAFTDAGFAPPHFFHVLSSAHLSQSDFGLLFPWLTKRAFKCEAAPERVLRLNVRGVLQFLRGNGVVVGGTGREDLVEDVLAAAGGGEKKEKGEKGKTGEWVEWDEAILEKVAEGKVEGWGWVDVVGLGGDAYPSELEMQGEKGETEEGEKEMEGEIEGEIEPSLETETAIGTKGEGVAVGGR